MKKILVIPDSHNRWQIVDSIINRHPEVDKIISLGDIFDDFNDSPQIARQTAQALSRWLDNPKFIWCQGNHDSAVLYCNNENPAFYCSGFALAKQKEIKEVLGDKIHNNRLFYWTGDEKGNSQDPNGFLLSHAGLHPDHLPYSNPNIPFNIIKWLEKESKEATEKAKIGVMSWIFAAGFSRGGRARLGGLTWMDYSEFEPIPGINQIFGHTPDRFPRNIITPNSENWCIDTHSNHYSIIEIDDGESGNYGRQKVKIYNRDGSVYWGGSPDPYAMPVCGKCFDEY